MALTPHALSGVVQALIQGHGVGLPSEVDKFLTNLRAEKNNAAAVVESRYAGIILSALAAKTATAVVAGITVDGVTADHLVLSDRQGAVILKIPVTALPQAVLDSFTGKNASDPALTPVAIGNTTVKVNPQGGAVLLKASPLLQEKAKFWVTTNPCWFPECADLRAKMQVELTAARSTNCTSCEEGAILRKYGDLAEPYIKAAMTTTTTIPPKS